MEGIFDKIGVDPGIVIIAILVAMLVLLLIVLVLFAKVRDITRKYTNFMRGEDGKSLERSVERRFREMGAIVRAQSTQASRQQLQESIQNRSLTKYGIVKYDAFEDVGGKLSFALALLDKNDTGFVLNAIHGKENCFLYLKEIVKGESYIMLSREEIEALRSAKKFGSEEEAILKYQVDRSVMAEKRYAERSQEMKRTGKSPEGKKHAGSRTSVRSSKDRVEQSAPAEEEKKVRKPLTDMSPPGSEEGAKAAQEVPDVRSPVPEEMQTSRRSRYQSSVSEENLAGRYRHEDAGGESYEPGYASEGQAPEPENYSSVSNSDGLREEGDLQRMPEETPSETAEGLEDNKPSASVVRTKKRSSYRRGDTKNYRAAKSVKRTQSRK